MTDEINASETPTVQYTIDPDCPISEDKTDSEEDLKLKHKAMDIMQPGLWTTDSEKIEEAKDLDDVRKNPAEYNNRLEEIRTECFKYHKEKTSGTYIEDVQFLLAYIEGMTNDDVVMRSYIEKSMRIRKLHEEYEKLIEAAKKTAHNEGVKKGRQEAYDVFMKHLILDEDYILGAYTMSDLYLKDIEKELELKQGQKG